MRSVWFLALSGLLLCISAEDDSTAKGEAGHCEAPPRDNKDDLIPRSQLMSALETLKEYDEKLRRKEDLVKDIRSRFKYFREQVSDLTKENQALNEKLEQESKDREEKHRKLTAENKKLNKVVTGVRTELRCTVDDDVQHKAWRMRSDLRICKEDTEDFERERSSWDMYMNTYMKDMNAMHEVEFKCRKDLKKCTNTLIDTEALVSLGTCKDALHLYEDAKALEERLKLKKKKDRKDDEFLHEVIRQYGKCMYEAHSKSSLDDSAISESTKLSDMQEFCGQMKASLDRCIDSTSKDPVKPKGDNTKLAMQLKECENKLKVFEKITTKAREDKANSKAKAKEDNAPKATLYSNEAYEESLEDIKMDDGPKATLYSTEDPLEGVELFHPMPYKPDEVPDITNMSIEDIHKEFAILKQDYQLMWLLADESAVGFGNCVQIRQDAVIMKYFSTKELYHTKVQLEEALEELQAGQEDCSSQVDESQFVAMEEFELMKRERTQCLDDIKQVRRKSAMDAKELKYMRDDYAKKEKESKEIKDQYEGCKANADHLDFVSRGAQMLVQEMEKTEEGQKKKVMQQEEELTEAIAGAERFRLYFTTVTIFLTIMITIQLYGFLVAYYTQQEAEKTEAKRLEKAEKRASRKLKTK